MAPARPGQYPPPTEKSATPPGPRRPQQPQRGRRRSISSTSATSRPGYSRAFRTRWAFSPSHLRIRFSSRAGLALFLCVAPRTQGNGKTPVRQLPAGHPQVGAFSAGGPILLWGFHETKWLRLCRPLSRRQKLQDAGVIRVGRLDVREVGRRKAPARGSRDPLLDAAVPCRRRRFVVGPVQHQHRQGDAG